jgi:hypothetical protein
MAQYRLAILPGRTHYDLFLAPELAETTLTFLDDIRNTVNWAKRLPGRMLAA